jgi:transcriptional regulator with XRE-family HTH domain
MPTTPGSALGDFIREQRHLARLSLREMARLTSISNAYLSQVERGLHEPSVRVLHAVADALGVPFEELVGRAGPARPETAGAAQGSQLSGVERAIRQESRLSAAQKEALISVFRGFLDVGAEPGDESADG